MDIGTVVTWRYETQVSPVMDVLFCALREPLARRDLASKAGALGAADWSALADLAIDLHRVGPRLWRALESAAREAVPADVAARLSAEARRAALHALAAKAETARAAAALNRAGVEPTLLKGWALEADLFGEIGRRVTRDLDLLVRAEELPAAVATLRDAGYACALTGKFGSSQYLASFMRFSHHVVFVRPQSRIMIELHARPFRNEHLLPADTLESEPRILKTVDGAAQYRVPTPRWNFVYLALHGFRHRWERAKWLVDLPPLLHRLSPADWRWVETQAERLAVAPALGIALVLARDFLGAEIPGRARALLDRAERSYLTGACRRELLASEPYADRPTLVRWLESHAISFGASPRLAVVGASVRSLVVRESDVLPSRLANRFRALHYFSAVARIPQRVGQRVVRRVLPSRAGRQGVEGTAATSNLLNFRRE